MLQSARFTAFSVSKLLKKNQQEGIKLLPPPTNTHTHKHTHTHTHSHTHRLGLTEKQQKYQHYNPEKLINMNILQVKK